MSCVISCVFDSAPALLGISLVQRPGERLREGSEMATGPGVGFRLHGAEKIGGGRCDQLHGGDGLEMRGGSVTPITYPLVNKQLDPENHQFLMETSLPTPMTARVYVNLPEGNTLQYLTNVNPGLITPKRLFNWGDPI